MSLFKKKTEEKKKEDAKEASEKPASASMKDLYNAPTTPKTSGVKGEKKGVRAAYGNGYRILVKPLVTEKVSNLGALNKYVFAVARQANKIEVARAIQEIYGIKPLGVNVINKLGKKARYGRSSGRRKDWKKAIVTLPQGQTIKIYEGV